MVRLYRRKLVKVPLVISPLMTREPPYHTIATKACGSRGKAKHICVNSYSVTTSGSRTSVPKPAMPPLKPPYANAAFNPSRSVSKIFTLYLQEDTQVVRDC